MRIVGYNWNGTPIYGQNDGSPATTSKDMVVSTKSKQSGQTLNSILGAAPSLLNGVANIIGASRGNNSIINNQPMPQTPQQPDNTIWYLAGGLILVILILVFLNRS